MFLHKFNLVALATLTATLAACGKGDDDKSTMDPTSSSALFEDAQAQSEFAAAGASEGLNNAVSGEDVDTSASLGLADHDATHFKSFEKKCDGGVVTITSNVERSQKVENKNILRERSLKGSGNQVRTWKKDGAAVECAANGRHAKIDWSNPAGLTLDLTLERARSQSFSITNKRRNTTWSRSSSFSLNGSRNVKWLSASKDDEKIVRVKEITSNVNRTMVFKKKDGMEMTATVAVKTKDGAPLKVEIVRAASVPHVLKQKTLQSGVLVSALKDGGRTETEFAGLVFGFDSMSKECSVQSGAFTVSYFDKDGADKGKLSCSVDAESAALACKDAAGANVEVPEPSCDPEDLF